MTSTTVRWMLCAAALGIVLAGSTAIYASADAGGCGGMVGGMMSGGTMNGRMGGGMMGGDWSREGVTGGGMMGGGDRPNQQWRQ